ncbi:MAG: helicase-exonuclease AddAB subunit AddA [Ruminococcaceae bacterium]|nr:helicase-exonuclease AddAB subunit AddA [Oscillospiraceae bacterium]
MPELTKQQQAVIDSRGGALLVSAAAGSGKTFVLVRRLMEMMTDINDPASITDFLIITFTKAAASELHAKITDEIRRRLLEQGAGRHLRRQLTLVHAAKIMTIHGFCSSVLRENAQLVDITPDFRQIEESESKTLMSKALDEVLEIKYSNIENDPDFAALTETLSATYNDKRLCDTVFDAYEKIRTHPDMDKWMDDKLEIFENADTENTPWEREILDSCIVGIDFWIRRYEDLIEHQMLGDEALEKAYLPAFQDDLSVMKSFRAALNDGWDEAYNNKDHVFAKLGRLVKYPDEDLKQRLQDIRKGFKTAWGKYISYFDINRSELILDIEKQLPVVRGLFSVIKDLDRRYSMIKRRRGVVDFGDLEHMCLDLLRNSNGTVSETGLSIAKRFREIMVDEYQDTNEIQDSIINAVSQNGKNIFMVGDVKQSIYRFRLADPTIFLEKYQRFPDSENAVEGEGRKIILSRNFRSRASVLDAVNDVFENIMSEGFGEMEYGDNEKLYCGADYDPTLDIPVEFNIVDLRETDDEDIDRSTAEAMYVAERIAYLLKNETVRDEATGGIRPIEPRDIAILMRAPGLRSRLYISELERLGIPSAFSGGSSGLLDTDEARMLISLLQVIDNPHQDIPLIATMKSPLFGFSADDLAAVRTSDYDGNFYTALKSRAESDEKCRNFIDRIQKFRYMAEDLSADELIWEIFSMTDIISVCAAMDRGDIRRKNLLLLYQYAQTFENNGYRGLFGFVSRLNKLYEQGDNLVGAGDSLEGNVVTITSIHKSKGLEYPVVFLCDLSKKFNLKDTQSPMLVHRQLGVGSNIRDLDRMIEYPSVMRRACELRMKRESLSEELRVLYVGMTRAKERLILTASFNNAERELRSCMTSASAPVEPQLLLNAGSCAKWLLYIFMSRTEGRQLLGYDVGKKGQMSCWNISLVCPGNGKIDTVETDVDVPPCEAQLIDLKERFSSEYQFKNVIGLPAKVTASALKGRYLDAEASEQGMSVFVSDKGAFKRPRFAMEKQLTSAEKGTAAHLVMQYIDFKCCTDEAAVEAEMKRLSDMEIVSQQMIDAVQPSKIFAFFESDIGKRMLKSQSIMREFKFSILAPSEMFYDGAGDDALMLQGVVDCCFEEDGQLVLVDFKTDNVFGSDVQTRAQSYKTQMEIYSYALKRITGKNVKEKVLYFFAPSQIYEL